MASQDVPKNCLVEVKTSKCFIYFLVESSVESHIHQLVGGLEPWNFMTFHSVGNFIIPTDELIFFRRVETTNQ
jgi:hypothetical protein